MSALQKAITCSLHPKIPSNSARKRYATTPAQISPTLINERQREERQTERGRGKGVWKKEFFRPDLGFFHLFFLFWVWTHSALAKCTFVMPIEATELEWKAYWVYAHRGSKEEVVYWWVPLPASPRFPLYCDFEWMYPLAKGTGMCLLNSCDGWGLVLHSSAPPSESLFLSLSLWLFHPILLFSTNKSQRFFISCCEDLRAAVIFHQECVTHHYSAPPSHKFRHWQRGRSRWGYTINELFKWDTWHVL